MKNIGVKLAIKLLKEGNTIGSGFYIPLPKHDYDLIGTAKHCLCNKKPNNCSVDNPNICDNCSEPEYRKLEFKSNNSKDIFELYHRDPIIVHDRDVAFVKVKRLKDWNNGLLINKETVDIPLKTYGFPDGDNGEGTFKTFNNYVEKENSVLELEFSNNSTGNLETQQSNLAGLSGSGIYTSTGSIVGIYTGTQPTGNGIAVKFDKHIISFLNDNNISLANREFESFVPYSEDAFEGFVKMSTVWESETKTIIDSIAPQKVLDDLKIDLFHSPKFQTVESLIAYLEQQKEIDYRLWSGWLQLLTYLQILQVDISDTTNLLVKFEIEKEGRVYGKELKLKLFFSDKNSYDSSIDYIQKKFNQNTDNNSCLIFRSIKDQNEKVEFSALNHIVENITGIDPLAISNLNIGALGFSKLTDVAINCDNLNQVRTKLKKCFQDAIK